MRAHKIVVFIFSIIASLALISIVFPEEGITIRNIHLSFPSISEVLGIEERNRPKSEAEQYSPEEILSQRHKE